MERAKSSVYRLWEDGSRSTIVAKRAAAESVAVEATVLGTLAPNMRGPFVRYLGSWRERGSDQAWIFMEDAGDGGDTTGWESLLGTWLARIHADASGARPAGLPMRGPDYYLRHLQRGRANLQQSLATPDPRNERREVVDRTIEACNEIEDRWRAVADGSMSPPTLVHGDVAKKHARIRPSASGRTLVLLDWETAGWGTPAPDLEMLCSCTVGTGAARALQAYRYERPATDAETLRRLACSGAMFRAAATIDWASQALGPHSGQGPLWKLRGVLEVLAHLIPRFDAWQAS